MAAKKQPDYLSLGFELIAEHGWGKLSLSAIAAKAGVPIQQVRAALGSKSGLLRQFAARIDQATFDIDMGELNELTAKERLFELLMRRFDALKPYKPAFLETQRRKEIDCQTASVLFCSLDRLAENLLDACESRYHGMQRRLARRALMAAYAKVFSVWLKDESEDLAQTMSELDKRLGQLETLARLSNPFGRRQPHTPASDAGEA